MGLELHVASLYKLVSVYRFWLTIGNDVIGLETGYLTALLCALSREVVRWVSACAYALLTSEV